LVWNFYSCISDYEFLAIVLPKNGANIENTSENEIKGVKIIRIAGGTSAALKLEATIF